MSKIIKILTIVFICFIVFDINISFAGGLDFNQSQGWFNQMLNGGAGEAQNLVSTMEKLLKEDLGKILATIGNSILLISFVALGIKYLFSTAEGKTEVKNSLIGAVVAAFMFYLAQNIFDFCNKIFTNIFKDGTPESIAGNIWQTFVPIANVLSLMGIVIIGIKYMMAPAEQKGNIKKDLGTTAIALLLIFSAVNILQFIVGVGKEFLK